MFNSSILILISRHNRFAWSCRSDDEGDAAPPPPAFSTPTKADRNDGAGHAKPDAERMETESDADAEQSFDESTDKKRKNTVQEAQVKFSVLPDSMVERIKFYSLK